MWYFDRKYDYYYIKISHTKEYFLEKHAERYILPNGRSSQAKMVSIKPALPNKTIKSVGQTIRNSKLSQKFSDIPESLNIAKQETRNSYFKVFRNVFF